MSFPFAARILHRLRWLHLPGALLVALLQRTPVLRVAAGAEQLLTASPLGAVVRSVFTGLASLGAVHALAGATTFIVQQGQTQIVRDGDPPRFNNPATGSVGTAIQSVLFTVTGALTPAGSFQITNLPPGLTIARMDSNGILNASSGVITGTPTTAGTFQTTILAYEFANGPAQKGNDTVGPITVTFAISGGAQIAPAITQQPVAQAVSSGASATFTAAASGSPAPNFQWRKNGATITGATTSTLIIASAQAADDADYSVVATNAAGSAVSNVVHLTVNVVVPVDPAARLVNLSVRTAMAASQTLIVGVVVNDGTRDVLVRAAGPALAAFGLTTAMQDPRLELYNRGATLVFSNDNWPAAMAPTFASVGAFGFVNGSKDAAFVQSLDAEYSIQARGTGAGVVLVEAYDTGPATAARMVNVSARNRVGTGDDILIAGFTISGSKQLLIRAVGPKLAAFGVPGVLADPHLEIFDGAVAKLT